MYLVSEAIQARAVSFLHRALETSQDLRLSEKRHTTRRVFNMSSFFSMPFVSDFWLIGSVTSDLARQGQFFLSRPGAIGSDCRIIPGCRA